MANPKPNTSGLKDTSAPDRPGETLAVTVRLPPELVNRLDRLAREQGVGRSYLMRQAIIAYLLQLPKTTHDV